MSNVKPKKNTALILIHCLLVALELIALIHDIYSFGLGSFRYYTIDSNVLQMFVSGAIIYILAIRHGEKPGLLVTVAHLICAVCLTITFLIALFVLAPQEGFAYYFLTNVAPINHLLGPFLSVASFLFAKYDSVPPRKALLAPMAATLIYGVILLALNWLRITDGPYFFLRIHDEAPATVIMWFSIISVLCLALSGAYMWIRKKYVERLHS